MRSWKLMALVPAMMLAAACHKDDNHAAADSALNRDLGLANQVAPYQDSISPVEAGYAPTAGPSARAPAPRTTTRAATRSTASSTRRTATRRSSSSGSSGT